MTNGQALRKEPEPIDADYEPAGKAKAKRDRAFAPPPMRSRSPSRIEMILTSAAAAAIGAIVAIAATNANSNGSTGTLASELDALKSGQDELGARISQASSDVVALRSRIEAQADRLDHEDEGVLALRADISALTSQVSALIGAGPGTEVPGAMASNSPLGTLLSRINKLESTVSEDAAAPKTTKQMQRSISDLGGQIAALEAANVSLSAAVNQRQAALEDGMKVLSSEVGLLRGRAAANQKFGLEAGVLRKPAVDLSAPVQTGKADAAVAESRTIRAFASLESAAQRGTPFASEQQELASLLPKDEDVAALNGPAQRGVPSLDQLRREFDTAAANAERLLGDQADDGWNWLRAAFPGFSSSPETVDQTTAALIVKARRFLESGSARGAVNTIGALPAPAGEAFTQWREKALKRANLEDRLSSLNNRLLGAATVTNQGG